MTTLRGNTGFDVLGERWIMARRTSVEDRALESCSGYCDFPNSMIVVIKDLDTSEPDSTKNPEEFYKKVARHEVVHAFLSESGLAQSSIGSEAWAMNEEMVDWIAVQGPKIYKVWQKLGAV